MNCKKNNKARRLRTRTFVVENLRDEAVCTHVEAFCTDTTENGGFICQFFVSVAFIDRCSPTILN